MYYFYHDQQIIILDIDNHKNYFVTPDNRLELKKILISQM